VNWRRGKKHGPYGKFYGRWVEFGTNGEMIVEEYINGHLIEVQGVITEHAQSHSILN